MCLRKIGLRSPCGKIQTAVAGIGLNRVLRAPTLGVMSFQRDEIAPVLQILLDNYAFMISCFPVLPKRGLDSPAYGGKGRTDCFPVLPKRGLDSLHPLQ